MAIFSIKEQNKFKKQGKKGCQSCGEVKSTQYFYIGKDNRIRSKCIVCSKQEQKTFREENPEVLRQRWKNWRDNNVEHRKQYNKKYREENVEQRRQSRKQYYQKNREQEIKNNIERQKQRLQTDELFKIKEQYRAVMKSAFRRMGWSKTTKTQEIVGCSWETFKTHIENQFQEGMTWDNHGFGEGHWNYDHITPISTAKTEEDIIKLNHYTNFQPLWAEDNLKKSDKISEEWGNVSPVI